MDIKYIKDAPNGPAGSIDTVTDFEANILIKAGFAEIDLGTEPEPPVDPNLFVGPPSSPVEPELPVEPKPKAKAKSKATAKTEDE